MEKNVKSLQIVLSAMIIFAFLLAPLTLNAQAGKANFAGTWALNAGKSNFGQPQGQPPQGQGQGQGQGQRMGGFGGGMGQEFVVTQDAGKLTTERTRTGQDGQTTKVTTVYKLDGTESVNTTARGESKSTAKWSADGKSLTVVTTSTFGDRTITSTAVWALDGAALTIKTTTATPNGDRTTTAVYDKK